MHDPSSTQAEEITRLFRRLPAGIADEDAPLLVRALHVWEKLAEELDEISLDLDNPSAFAPEWT